MRLASSITYKDDYDFLFERDENGMIIFDYLCQEIGENVVKEALEEVFFTIKDLPRNPNVEKSKVPRRVLWLDDLWVNVGLEEPKTKRQRLATDRGISDEVAQSYMETIWVPVKGHIVRATEEIEKDIDIYL